jgi:hypothetical protein
MGLASLGLGIGILCVSIYSVLLFNAVVVLYWPYPGRRFGGPEQYAKAMAAQIAVAVPRLRDLRYLMVRPVPHARPAPARPLPARWLVSAGGMWPRARRALVPTMVLQPSRPTHPLPMCTSIVMNRRP